MLLLAGVLSGVPPTTCATLALHRTACLRAPGRLTGVRCGACPASRARSAQKHHERIGPGAGLLVRQFSPSMTEQVCKPSQITASTAPRTPTPGSLRCVYSRPMLVTIAHLALPGIQLVTDWLPGEARVGIKPLFRTPGYGFASPPLPIGETGAVHNEASTHPMRKPRDGSLPRELHQRASGQVWGRG